jgi:NADH dehydrogenase
MVSMPELNVVTGAFGYSGKYIARRLLDGGKAVKTITAHPGRADPFGERIMVARLDFDDPAELAKNLHGTAVLFNTYWVRFNYGQTTFAKAVANTRTLIRAAEKAGVERIVHISITNPSAASPFPYFSGKAAVEDAIRESRLSYAILRPAVIFGPEDILINNIAWLLRRFPVFAIPGAGEYRLQPVFAEDLAELAVNAGEHRTNLVMDAVGPETFSFNDLVLLIRGVIGSRARVAHLPPWLSLFLSKLVGYFVGDVVLTSDEVRGLMADLLVSSGSPTSATRLSDWLRANASVVGKRYASELARHYRHAA